MYLEHFGLTCLPFTIEPDTGFTYLSRSQRNALNVLLLAVHGEDRFVKVIGREGGGKTHLIRSFVDCLSVAELPGEGVAAVTITDPLSGPCGLYADIARQLGAILGTGWGHDAVREALLSQLSRLSRSGTRLLICVDEAQLMPVESLEALRVLANPDPARPVRIQVFLFGQHELDGRLAQDALRQLRSRISVHHCLHALTLEETAWYIAHRLAVAGASGSAHFSNGAIRQLHLHSEGLPRRINILCHKALLLAFAEGATAVGQTHTTLAVKDEMLRLGTLPWLAKLAGPVQRMLAWLHLTRPRPWLEARS